MQEQARSPVWHSPQESGQWVPITRLFRDGHHEHWWVLEVIVKHAYGPACPLRAALVTTAPVQLPEVSTWSPRTNLPTSNSARALSNPQAPADLAELVRLYGLRAWVEQSHKQVKHAPCWAQYQVPSDVAIRRPWALVFCTFTFCWWQAAEAFTAIPANPALQPASAVAAAPKKLPSRLPLSWPIRLRQVPPWLEPFILLKRYWVAFSPLHPPPILHLLDWLYRANPIDLFPSP